MNSQQHISSPGATGMNRERMFQPGSRKLIRDTVILDVLILFLVIFSRFSIHFGSIGGLAIIVYLTLSALKRPERSFFLFFGIKLTFDTLWFIKLPASIPGHLGLLELIVFPMLISVLYSINSIKKMKWPIVFPAIYVGWVICAVIINGQPVQLTFFFKQSGMLFGLLLGIAYIQSEEHLKLLITLVFISTAIPIICFFIQIVAATQLDIILMNYKVTTIRGVRLSGLYFDSGTSSMVSIVSLFCLGYILNVGMFIRKWKKWLLFFLAINLSGIFIGGTRSMVGVALVLIFFLFLTGSKYKFKIIPVLFIVLYLSKPFVDKIISKSVMEVTEPINFGQILTDEDYRILFTGRVGLWQDIWQQYIDSSFIQQLFGTGISSNSHSSYFFLLLQTGALSLIGYILFHILLLLKLKNSNIPPYPKKLGIISLASILLIGFSLSSITYSSFQWIVYMLVGGTLMMEQSFREKKPVFSGKKSNLKFPLKNGDFSMMEKDKILTKTRSGK